MTFGRKFACSVGATICLYAPKYFSDKKVPKKETILIFDRNLFLYDALTYAYLCVAYSKQHAPCRAVLYNGENINDDTSKAMVKPVGQFLLIKLACLCTVLLRLSKR